MTGALFFDLAFLLCGSSLMTLVFNPSCVVVVPEICKNGLVHTHTVNLKIHETNNESKSEISILNSSKSKAGGLFWNFNRIRYGYFIMAKLLLFYSLPKQTTGYWIYGNDDMQKKIFFDWGWFIGCGLLNMKNSTSWFFFFYIYNLSMRVCSPNVLTRFVEVV